MKRVILIATILLFINGIVFSQEPLVVTTVNKPAETNQKADVPVVKENSSQTCSGYNCLCQGEE